MSTLRIALLGAPEVEHDDCRLMFSERKALALLAYLAAEGGVHKRQRLSRLLWPESDMAHGRAALRITLLHLRHMLEEAPYERESHLLITHNALGLDMTSGIDLDLHALEIAWKVVSSLPAPEAVQAEARRSLITQLQCAADLYRGAFLQDFTLRDTLDFDNWVGMQQGYYYQRIELVFDWLSRLLKAQGELERAIAMVERWRFFDPLNEDISLRLMQLQFATGNRIAALKTYETYQEVLMTELRAKPSTKLAALADLLRHSSPPRHDNRHAPPDRLQKSSASERPFLTVPFVGRGAEISQLMSLFEEAGGGKPQVVLLEGETGIGKSRLAAVFLGWLRAQGANILEGKTYPTSQRLPYQPLIEALRICLEQEPDLRQRLGDLWLAELSRLLPDLRERYPDLPPPTSDRAFATFRLFEALARLSQALAAQAPLVLFADDMQWIDSATLDVFQYLARYWTEHRMPVMLLLSRRAETRELEPELSEWLASLKKSISLTRLQLAPLSLKETLEIARSLLEADEAHLPLWGELPGFRPSSQYALASASTLSTERFGVWLFAQTQGQPFFVRAILETLLDRGDLVPRLLTESGWVFEPQPSILDATAQGTILPSDIYEVIQRRLVRISLPARNLLRAGAALDHDFTFEELCYVAQLAPQEGLAALDEALHDLLLHESSQLREGRSQVSYHFAHNKIREVISLAAGDACRRVFHKRALAVLKRANTTAASLTYTTLSSGEQESSREKILSLQ
jgi:DNA-binding SARP family transcriptional activator